MDGSEAVNVFDKLQLDGLILSGLMVLIWGLRLVDNFLLGNRLNNNYGLRPRTQFSAGRFLLSPFLHINRQHLFSNSIPLLVLGWLVMLPETSYFWIVSLVILFISNTGIWIFGAPGSSHIGASGLGLGYFGYVFIRGFVNQNGAEAALSVFVIAVYFWLFAQILPREKGISRSGHFFGFVGGILAALVNAWLEGGGWELLSFWS